MKFTQKLRRSLKKSKSCLCIGLDPDMSRMPASLTDKYDRTEECVVDFLKEVIDLTSDTCAAYKPNLGFFEALGSGGLEVFREIIDYIPEDKIIIADAKRGDISSTAEHYARAYFELFDVDAITINPLMGFDSLDPFRQYPEKGLYVLTLTSNPGAEDFFMQRLENHKKIAGYIAEKLYQLQQDSETHLGMVLGATRSEQLKEVLKAHPEGGLLVPGVGTQGGSVEKITDALFNHAGIPLINSSRSILYAGADRDDWQQAVKKKAFDSKYNLKAITEHYV